MRPGHKTGSLGVPNDISSGSKARHPCNSTNVILTGLHMIDDVKTLGCFSRARWAGRVIILSLPCFYALAHTVNAERPPTAAL